MKQAYPQMVLGYAAGNVIGASHLIALLAQVSALVNPIEGRGPRSGLLPAIVVKNSRLEPLFAPLLFAALEQIDASLVSTTAILIWDYEDASLQEYLVSRANLVIAAAADSTIDEIDDVIRHLETCVVFHIIKLGALAMPSAIQSNDAVTGIIQPIEPANILPVSGKI